MRRLITLAILVLVFLGVMLHLADPIRVEAGPLLQEVTPVFRGIVATVKSDDNADINVRGGPGIDYALLGKLLPGQQVPAVGRSPGGDWVQIAYPEAQGGVAWVYAHLVTLSGSLPVVELPPTPTPLVTPTLDPTLAAQFIREIPPTRLPTFTPPPPLVIPTYADEPLPEQGRSTVIFIIAGLSILGVVGMLMSFIRVR
jgi:hypothetical protein